MKGKVAQSCPTLRDPMDYTVHGILQARTLEWIAFPSPGDLPNPGIETRSPTLQVDSLPNESQEKPWEIFSPWQRQGGRTLELWLQSSKYSNQYIYYYILESKCIPVLLVHRYPGKGPQAMELHPLPAGNVSTQQKILSEGIH